MERKLYQEMASLLNARATCARTGNDEWFAKHTDSLEELTREHMPSGSGFDSETQLDLEDSSENKIVFHTSFHHMNDEWTDHSVIVRPSLAFGFVLRITGRDRNQIKDHIAEAFETTLRTVTER
jgi:hypothetical protein